MDAKEHTAPGDEPLAPPTPHELARDAMDGSAVPMQAVDSSDVRQSGADLAERVAAAALRNGVRVGVAESLTSGAIAATLGAATDASEWFSGGIVAYRPEVKFSVLGVPPGPVITEEAARRMASGCARALGSDVSVAVTGAGGPGPQEGQRAGTVFIAVHTDQDVLVQQNWFSGDPRAVVDQTVDAALQLLASRLEARTRRHS